MAVRQGRHIILPRDLRDNDYDYLRDKPILRLLATIFPGTREIMAFGGHCTLSLILSDFPAEPWPLTVGGIPITICVGDDLFSCHSGRGPLFPMTLLREGQWRRIRIAMHLGDIRDEPSPSAGLLRTITAELQAYIRTHTPHVTLVEVLLASERRFYVVLADGTDMTVARSLPGTMARGLTGYFLESELQRPPSSHTKHVGPSISSEDRVSFNDLVSLQSLGSAPVEATVSGRSLRFNQDGDGVLYDWLYMGQVEGRQNPEAIAPHSTPGDPVVDANGRAVAEFTYYIPEGRFAGFAAAVSAEEMSAPAHE